MLEELAMAKNSIKISRRDFPYAIAKNLSGGTTVAGTMMIANQVFFNDFFLVYFVLHTLKSIHN